MHSLLDDLVDFNRTKPWSGVQGGYSNIDLATPVTDELEHLRGAYPARRIELTVSGDCRGTRDALRIQQLLRKLVSNAVKYGEPDMPVRVTLRSENGEVCVEVINSGAPIDSSALQEISDPLKRGNLPNERDDPASLRLGLFIVREIARAHGGDVQTFATGEKTTFTVRLPRHRIGVSS